MGGWTYSANFAAALSTTSGQATFASSGTNLVKNLGFDGIDIDWKAGYASSNSHPRAGELREVEEIAKRVEERS